jgi:hypothetical protein
MFFLIIEPGILRVSFSLGASLTSRFALGIKCDQPAISIEDTTIDWFVAKNVRTAFIGEINCLGMRKILKVGTDKY